MIPRVIASGRLPESLGRARCYNLDDGRRAIDFDDMPAAFGVESGVLHEAIVGLPAGDQPTFFVATDGGTEVWCIEAKAFERLVACLALPASAGRA